MPRTQRKNKAYVEKALPPQPQLNPKQTDTRSNFCNYLRRGVASLAITAGFKYAGYKAATSALYHEFFLSTHMPFWMQNFFSADESPLVLARRFIVSLIVSPDNALSQTILSTAVLAPILEDTKRIAYHHAIKKIQQVIAFRFFRSKDFADTKVGTVMRIVIAALLAGMDHFQSSIPYEVRNHPEYLTNPIKRELIDQYTWVERKGYDASLISNIVTALGYSIIYEMNDSLPAVMACHSISNLSLVLSGNSGLRQLS